MNLNLENTQRHIIAIAESKNIKIEEAEKLLQKSSLILKANSDIGKSYSMQEAFLTCYNVGSRIFKGGVYCDLPENTPNLLKFGGDTFEDVLASFFKLKKVSQKNAKIPKILFGIAPNAENEAEVICTGWQGGINIYNSQRVKLENKNSLVPLGACLASSYALFWAFEHTFSVAKSIYFESFGLSLWDKSLENNWYNEIGEGPTELWLLPKIWLVGLGHLGQSYLWVLSQIHLKAKIELLLQDYGTLGIENLGSQILSFEHQIGKYKTRICSNFLEKLDIKTQILEKRFVNCDQEDASLKMYEAIITGLDNVESRAIINTERFKICLDGATNGKLENFDSFTFRNLSKMKKKPAEIWSKDLTLVPILHKNLAKMITDKGGCGELTNFGISTPFVGLFGAAILISEFVKCCNKGKFNTTFSGKMRTRNSYDCS